MSYGVHDTAMSAAAESLAAPGTEQQSSGFSQATMRDAEALVASLVGDEWKFDEEKRLAALLQYNIHDSAAEPQFDALTRAAAQICDVPASLITFIAKDQAQYGRHTQRHLA